MEQKVNMLLNDSSRNAMVQISDQFQRRRWQERSRAGEGQKAPGTGIKETCEKSRLKKNPGASRNESANGRA